MFRSWYNHASRRQSTPSAPRRKRPRSPLQVEALEDRCVPAVTPIAHTSAFTEGINGTATIAGFVDTDNVTPSNFTNISINWGDGTAADTTTGSVSQPNAGGEFLITGSHTYGEEGRDSVTVTVHDVLNNVNRSITLSSANVADAPLLPGNSPTATHQEFTGVGGTNTAGASLNALNAFKSAIGGANNGAVGAPQNGGFRVITWDGVALDGTDFGGNTTVIIPNNTVGIPINRFQNVGVIFEEVYAVSGDGFKSVNPNVNAANPQLFPAFSPTKTFAMFNDHTIGMSFVLPSSPATTPVPAATRGFGAIFLNVRTPNTSSIEYFAGDQSLGKFFVPAGQQGEPEFLGEFFSSPVVTRVELTLGTDVIFFFDGTTIRSGGANNLPDHNLVDTDDFVHAEPVPLAGTQPAVAASATVRFNGTVATFHDTDPNGTARDYTATIDWGDGHRSPGVIVANTAGGFDVQGANTYTAAGTFPIRVLIQDLGLSSVAVTNTAHIPLTATTTTLTESASSALAGQPITFTATVHATAGSAIPTGTVAFLDGGAVLARVTVNAAGQATLSTALAPGAHAITAVYSGDAAFTGSSAAVSASVSADVTSLFHITLGAVRAAGRGRFRQRVTLQNVSLNPVPAPLELALDGLSRRVRLSHARGVTRLQPPGSPFAGLDLGGVAALTSGGVLTVDLEFLSPSRRTVHFTPRVLAGTVLL
jgi:hypothetical protein